MSDVLIAHPKTKDAVQYFISSPSHALAIIGNDGAGKSYIADYIASALLKVSQAKLLSHAYIYKLDAAQSDTGIDTVRELQKKSRRRWNKSRVQRADNESSHRAIANATWAI